MVVENVQRKEFPSPGRCIYCGSSGGADVLGDEHVIALSLGGLATILAASCRDCEKITSYLDGYLGRGVFGEFRAHAGIKRRRRKKDTPALTATIVYGDREEAKNFATNEHPLMTAVPAMPAPGILEGRQASPDFAGTKAHHYHWVPENLGAILGLQDGEQLSIRSQGELKIGTFCRAIAKMAYCQAICSLGIDGFRALALPDIILGKYPYISHFVGGGLETPPPPGPPFGLHEIRLGVESFGSLRLLVAHVRLFASSGTESEGMPIYEVVVGAPKTGPSAA